jgi:DNA-binding MurR/RpiR family transcriptional regulator
LGTTFSLHDTLRAIYPSLTRGQRRAAEFLTQHTDEAQFLTAKQLGMRCGYSEAGIVRFAQVLGFGGYPELRRAIRDAFRLSANGSMLESARYALQDESDLPRAIAKRDADLIAGTAMRLDRASLDRCVTRILSASDVFVVGHRASHGLAEYLAINLRQGIGVGTSLSVGVGTSDNVIASCRDDAVAIAISIAPYSPDTLGILRAAKRLGLFCVAVTDHPLGAPARLGDEVILFETEIQAYTTSYVGALTVIHVLLALIGRAAGERTMRLSTRLKQIARSDSGARDGTGGVDVAPNSVAREGYVAVGRGRREKGEHHGNRSAQR